MFLCFKDLTNIDLFLTSREVEESLLRRETAPCLAWCYDNKSKLRKNKVLILLPLQIWEIYIVKRSPELLVGQVLLILFIFFNTWRLDSCKIKLLVQSRCIGLSVLHVSMIQPSINTNTCTGTWTMKNYWICNFKILMMPCKAEWEFEWVNKHL